MISTYLGTLRGEGLRIVAERFRRLVAGAGVDADAWESLVGGIHLEIWGDLVTLGHVEIGRKHLAVKSIDFIPERGVEEGGETGEVFFNVCFGEQLWRCPVFCYGDIAWYFGVFLPPGVR